MEFLLVLLGENVLKLPLLRFSLLAEDLNLLVASLELCEDAVEVNVLEDFQVLHLVLQLVNSLALRVLVLLQPSLFVVQVLQLPLQLLN